MGKAVKKQKLKKVTKKKTSLRLVRITDSNELRGDKALSEMFKPDTKSVTVNKKGEVEVRQYPSFTPEDIKNSFAYQQLLAKYQRARLKQHNKTSQLRAERNKSNKEWNNYTYKYMDLQREINDREMLSEFALKLLNRARRKYGQSELDMKELERQYERSLMFYGRIE